MKGLKQPAGKNSILNTAQKAERFFKERRVAYQFVDLSRRGMSLRELESVCRAVGLENMVRLSDKDWESHYVAQLRDTKEALEKLRAHVHGVDVLVGHGELAAVSQARLCARDVDEMAWLKPDIWKDLPER